PLSLPVAVGLVLVLRGVLRSAPGEVPPRSRRRDLAVLVGSGVLFALFPLLQIAFFGSTDYRRPADAVVVFGAKAYADGTPSRALSDRVLTGVALWREGLAPRLVFSGGPGDGEVHETECMRRQAVSLGVPDDVILLDPEGLCTADTARNTARMARERGWSGVLAVSQAFHLPRIKMAFRRVGLTAWTVPAVETRPLRSKPYLMAREVAAYWAYWIAAAF
ncbi:MAG: YdcF family protein, partial [Planctomycetota bacterium]